MSTLKDNRSFIKLVVVGESNGGKTALLRRYTEHSFVPESLKSTIGSDFRTKRVKLPNYSKLGELTLQLWDTAGQERFRAISNSYYRGSEGAILVYDVGSRESFERLDYWLDEILKGTGRKTLQGFSVFVAGNKCDLPRYEVSPEEALAWCNTKGLSHINTSAMTGQNVEALFIACATSAMDYRESTDDFQAIVNGIPNPRILRQKNDSNSGNKKDGCAC